MMAVSSTPGPHIPALTQKIVEIITSGNESSAWMAGRQISARGGRTGDRSRRPRAVIDPGWSVQTRSDRPKAFWSARNRALLTRAGPSVQGSWATLKTNPASSKRRLTRVQSPSFHGKSRHGY